MQVSLGNVLNLIDYFHLSVLETKNYMSEAYFQLYSVIMATHETVFSWAQRLKNLCFKVFSLWVGLTENNKHKTGFFFHLYKWTTVLCTRMGNLLITFLMRAEQSVCMIRRQCFLDSWKKRQKRE